WLKRPWSCGVFGAAPRAFDKGLSSGTIQRGAAEEPGALGKRVKRLNFGIFGGNPQRLWVDREMSGSSGQIEPRFDPVLCRTVHRNLVMRPQCCSPLARPAVAVPSGQLVPVQQPGDQIIIGNEYELPNSVDDIRSGTVALAAPPAGQP